MANILDVSFRGASGVCLVETRTFPDIDALHKDVTRLATADLESAALVGAVGNDDSLYSRITGPNSRAYLAGEQGDANRPIPYAVVLEREVIGVAEISPNAVTHTATHPVGMTGLHSSWLSRRALGTDDRTYRALAADVVRGLDQETRNHPQPAGRLLLPHSILLPNADDQAYIYFTKAGYSQRPGESAIIVPGKSAIKLERPRDIYHASSPEDTLTPEQADIIGGVVAKGNRIAVTPAERLVGEGDLGPLAEMTARTVENPEAQEQIAASNWPLLLELHRNVDTSIRTFVDAVRMRRFGIQTLVFITPPEENGRYELLGLAQVDSQTHLSRHTDPQEPSPFDDASTLRVFMDRSRYTTTDEYVKILEAGLYIARHMAGVDLRSAKPPHTLPEDIAAYQGKAGFTLEGRGDIAERQTRYPALPRILPGRSWLFSAPAPQQQYRKP